MEKIPVYLPPDYEADLLNQFKMVALQAIAEVKDGVAVNQRFVSQKDFMNMFRIGYETMQDLYNRGLDYSMLGRSKMIDLEQFYQLLKENKF